MSDLVLFSRDRACQLELLLRSLKQHLAGWQRLRVSVLYTYEERACGSAYDAVLAMHPEFEYLCERELDESFEQAADRLAGDALDGAFLSDDHVFARPISTGTPAELAELADRNPAAGHDPLVLNRQFLARRRLTLTSPPGEPATSPPGSVLTDPTPPLAWEPWPEPGGNRTRPTVSVVVPCHNASAFLPSTLGTVFAQTLSALELIVVDDDSTDDSVAVARGLAAAHPQTPTQVLRIPHTGHPSHPRNAGIALARGDYILCLDADDELVPEFLERCVAALEAAPEISIAFTDIQEFEASDAYTDMPEYDLERLRLRNGLGNASLFRRQAWVDVGGFDPLTRYEDWNFWLDCGLHGHPATKVHGIHWRYRVRHDGRYRSGGAPRDRMTKARMVLRRAELYTGEQLAWARAALAGEPAGELADRELGIIPSHVTCAAALAAAGPRTAATGPRTAATGPRTAAATTARPRVDQRAQFLTVALAEEAIANPTLVVEYARRFGAGDDARLILFAPDADAAELAARLAPLASAAGLNAPGSAEVQALAVPAASGTSALLQSANALLSDAQSAGELDQLPRFTSATVDRLRSLWQLSQTPQRPVTQAPVTWSYSAPRSG